MKWLKKFIVRYLGIPMKDGFEKKSGWKAPIMFYLFYCKKCKQFRRDNKHGFEGYLICDECEKQRCLT